MYAKSDTRSSLISQAVIRIATDMGIESYVREIRHGYSICAGEFVIVDMADNTSVKMIISDYKRLLSANQKESEKMEEKL